MRQWTYPFAYQKKNRTLLTEYASELGLTKFSDNDFSEISETLEATSSKSTYLYYTTTYNPYRAIYDIKTYQAEDNARMVMDNISSGSMGYSVCEVYEEGYHYDYDNDYESWKIIRSSNAF